MVGFDTIIAVHNTHQPHPHTNSTATEKKDLKFCMQPHLTILTTTKHNLILLFSGQGGDLYSSCVNPNQFFFSTDELTMSKRFLKQIFLFNISLWSKNCLTKNVFEKTIFYQNIFMPTFFTIIFLTWNYFLVSFFFTRKGSNRETNWTINVCDKW